MDNRMSPQCKFGYNELETTHHLFIHCPHFDMLNTFSSATILDAMINHLPARTSHTTQTHLLNITCSLFIDSQASIPYQILLGLHLFHLGSTLSCSTDCIQPLAHRIYKACRENMSCCEKEGFPECKYLVDVQNKHHIPDII